MNREAIIAKLSIWFIRLIIFPFVDIHFEYDYGLTQVKYKFFKIGKWECFFRQFVDVEGPYRLEVRVHKWHPVIEDGHFWRIKV